MQRAETRPDRLQSIKSTACRGNFLISERVIHVIILSTCPQWWKIEVWFGLYFFLPIPESPLQAAKCNGVRPLLSAYTGQH